MCRASDGRRQNKYVEFQNGKFKVQNRLATICVTLPRLYTYMSGQKQQAVEGADINGPPLPVPNQVLACSSPNSPVRTWPVSPCSPPLCQTLQRNAPMIHGSPLIDLISRRLNFTGMASIQQDVCALFLSGLGFVKLMFILLQRLARRCMVSPLWICLKMCWRIRRRRL